MQGFSPRNLLYMRAFALAWEDEAIVQRVVAQLPWRQNIALLDKLKDHAERLWYAQKSIEHGWGQSVLVHQIETRLHERQGKAITNFSQTLPAPQSDLANALLKDPYSFDFFNSGRRCPRAALRGGSSHPYPRISAGTRSRFCVCRESVPPHSRRERVFH